MRAGPRRAARQQRCPKRLHRAAIACHRPRPSTIPVSTGNVGLPPLPRRKRLAVETIAIDRICCILHTSVVLCVPIRFRSATSEPRVRGSNPLGCTRVRTIRPPERVQVRSSRVQEMVVRRLLCFPRGSLPEVCRRRRLPTHGTPASLPVGVVLAQVDQLAVERVHRLFDSGRELG